MNICEELGLKPFQEFMIKGNNKYKFRFNGDNRREYYAENCMGWLLCTNEEELTDILVRPDWIEIVKENDENEVNDEINGIKINKHDYITLIGIENLYGDSIKFVKKCRWIPGIHVKFNGEVYYMYVEIELDFLNKIMNEGFCGKRIMNEVTCGVKWVDCKVCGENGSGKICMKGWVESFG